MSGACFGRGFSRLATIASNIPLTNKPTFTMESSSVAVKKESAV